MKTGLRIVFMGTPDFAASILERIAGAGEDVVLAVTQPDRAKGRGKGVSMPQVKVCALEHGIEVFQPEKVKEAEAVEVIREKKPDVIIVAAFGQILPKDLLEIPKYGCINVHASLLPEYRGASPIQSSIMDGKKETGVTIMQMDEGLDTGDILMQRSIPIAEDETGGSLFDKLSELGAELMVEALPLIKDGKLDPVKQVDIKSSYAGMLKKNSGRIDFSLSAIEIERRVRAMDPWPGAYTVLDGKTLKIWKTSAIENKDTIDINKIGKITNITKDDFTVQCGSGSLVINELQLEGRKRMKTHDFLLGVKLKEGDELG